MKKLKLNKKLKNSLINLSSDLAIIFFAYWFYTNHNYFRYYFDHKYIFEWPEAFKLQIVIYNNLICSSDSLCLNVFKILIIGYLVVLIPFRLSQKKDARSKTRTLLKTLWNYIKKPSSILKKTLSPKDKTASLAVLVKVFFTPLMAMWMVSNIAYFFNHLRDIILKYSNFEDNFRLFFDTHVFWCIFFAILVVDVTIFAFGYIFEFDFLKNKIKSVEPTMLGWVVTLACYPPFNAATAKIFPWYAYDAFDHNFEIFSQSGNDVVHLSMNIFIIILMGIYSWATVALGAKASNLTNRGIVDHGPYKHIRHPAYVCKCSAWAIGAIPAAIIGLQSGILSFLMVIIGVGGITFIYYMRAITEERHLMSDPEYKKYCKKVPWKFIPGIV